MPMTCPLCAQQFAQRLQCPRCQVNLMPTSRPGEPEPSDPLPPHWSRNPWGRTVLGVLVSQGLYFGLRKLFLAGALVVGEQANGTHDGLFGLLAAQVIQTLALFVGSFFAGAGQRNGGIYGSMVGVWNGILCTTLQGLQGEPITAVMLYGQPILHAAFGAFGGLLGSWIWRPIQEAKPAPIKVLPPRPRLNTLFQLSQAEIHWVRILIGVGIAVGGYLWADTILSSVLHASEGRMSLQTSVQQTVLTLEITALAVFLGGGFAGATTWHGGVQGAWVGLICSAIWVGYRIGYLQDGELLPFMLMTGCILALSLLGGSFGSRLLPPMPREQPQKAHPAEA